MMNDEIEIKDENLEEVPLENGEEENEEILMEEGSLDGDKAEVEEAEKAEENTEATEDTSDEPAECENSSEVENTEEVAEESTEATEDTSDEPAECENSSEVENTEELAEESTEETEDEEVEDMAEEEADEAETAEEAEEAEKADPEEKEGFKLTKPENLDEIMSKICRKRGRKLIYRPQDALINITATVLGTDKNNEEKIKVKNILDAEIKEGVKLGYLDKFDGLKMGEIKEEYENDVIYEFAEQEFKRTGLLLDGEKVKVYVFDWDLQSCHHVGYIEGEEVDKIKPYLADSEKYSFDVCGIITGGKFRRVIKDESGKIKVEKGNDGKVGLELDITVINRKD